jgi:hypothetical protein
MLGLVRATRNTFGVTGIAPASQVQLVATFGLGTAAAIHAAADALPAGGIILIEFQRPGPGSTGLGSAGFIPLEWWPEDFAAMAYATSKNVIVVEPAGNGSVSLDDPIYNTPAPGFPATWRNPFNASNPDPGAVMVGAGAPPSGKHGTDRSRLSYSNYGARVNVQGWGEEIASTGYGDLFGADEDHYYTAAFRGTSGAAAMVAGAIALLQGVEVAGGKRTALTPPLVRQLLSNQTTSPQQDGGSTAPVTQHIGPRPDLGALIAALSPAKNESKDTKDSKEPKENKDAKDNKEKQEKESKENKDNKDNKDGKDTPDKPHKDSKDSKDRIPKEVKDGLAKEKDGRVADRLVGPDIATQPQLAAPPIVSTEPVEHFIYPTLRPDLSAGALLAEPDLDARDPEELARVLASPAPGPDA